MLIKNNRILLNVGYFLRKLDWLFQKQLIDSVSRLKDSRLIENEFSLTFKNVSLNETKKIEDLSPGLLSKSESLSFWEKM